MNAARVMLNDSVHRLPLTSSEDICTTWWSFLSEYQSSNWAQAGKTWFAHKGSEGPLCIHPSFFPSSPSGVCLVGILFYCIPTRHTHTNIHRLPSCRFPHGSYLLPEHQLKWEHKPPQHCTLLKAEEGKGAVELAYANSPSWVSIPNL